ncbi:hypothetical protein GGS23DRAFT_609265 [Durotheca rogersii]|uniref:uncharacterized protein n=1 Tax=Durotheca rogersii TaxID=419775 RepID=UPI00221EE33C|nr:uncharacterized protein GGS23DRAFT_609265 [Durotheca rogersii]KAI5868568.1 hypothetical protein GGS23DRAFT_609265 [Durotheca rogersii]
MMEQGMSIVVFNMLPTSVQSRLPALQSLRRPAALDLFSPRRRKELPQDDTVPGALTNSDEEPVVELQACTAATTTSTTTSVTNRTVGGGDGAKLSGGLDGYVPRLGMGINWRYAMQGSYLQHSASQEREDMAFARKSYIDSVAYMLKALPGDMDDHEVSIIQRALPKSCAPDTPQSQQDGAATIPVRADRAKTLLRFAVQGFVAGFVVLFYTLMSLLAAVVRAGAHYERQYNIAEHLVSLGVVLTTAVGKQSGALSGKIGAMSEGKVGRVVTDIAAWTVEGVAGGIEDGIGQGLHLIKQ